MGITVDINTDKSSLSIDGELTIYTVQQYKEAIVESLSVDKVLEVDLSGVDEVDVSGLQLLAALDKQLAENGNEMKITLASDVVIEAIEISRLMKADNFDPEGEKHES